MPGFTKNHDRHHPSLKLNIPQDFKKVNNNVKSGDMPTAPPVFPLLGENVKMHVNPIFSNQKKSDVGVSMDLEKLVFRQRSVSFPTVITPTVSTSMASMEPCKKFSEDRSNQKKIFSVDYTAPDPTRPYELKINGKSLYVNPKLLIDVSPVFATILNKKQPSIELHIEDISFEEIHEMIKSICPTELGLYPTPVTSKNVLNMARLAHQMNVLKLKEACERFIAHLSLVSSDASVLELVEFLVACYKYGLSKSSKIRLFEGIIGSMSQPDQLPQKTPQALKIAIKSLYNEHLKGRLSHGQLSNTAKLKVPCRVCRSSNPNLPTTPTLNGERVSFPTPNGFLVCTQCKHTICQDCISKPCSKKIEEFLEKLVQK